MTGQRGIGVIRQPQHIARYIIRQVLRLIRLSRRDSDQVDEFVNHAKKSRERSNPFFSRDRGLKNGWRATNLGKLSSQMVRVATARGSELS